MSQRLKRWESPRREGRNDKGKGGSARRRQLKKQTQMLRQKLKDQGNDNAKERGYLDRGGNYGSLFFLYSRFGTLSRLSLRSVSSSSFFLNQIEISIYCVRDHHH